MPFLKPQGQGFFKFCITVQSHERYFPCIFLAQTIHTLTKRVHQSEIFRLLIGWVKILQIPHATSDSNEIRIHNHLVCERTLSVRLRTKWLWV